MEMPRFRTASGGPVIHLQHDSHHSSTKIRSRGWSLAVNDSETEAGTARVFVKAVSGQNLAAADELFIWFQWTSDPYVEVKYKRRRFVSPVVAKNLNPEWNMKKIDLGTADACENEIIEFNVWDHDNGSSDDFLGCVLVSMGGICRLGPGTHKKTIDLGPSPFPEKRPKNGISGSICLEFEVVPVASAESLSSSPFSSLE